MKKALMVITSHVPKSGRVYDGSVEWSDGWGLDKGKDIALRKRGDKQLTYLATLAELGALKPDKDTIVWIKGREEAEWIKGQEKKNSLIDEFKTAVTRLTPACEVYLAFHDEFIRGLLKRDFLSQLKRYSLYSLGKIPNAPSPFENILRSSTGKTRLDPLADFDQIFDAFFLIPSDIFAFVKHKVVGIFSAIDMDLQTLMDNNFEESYWGPIIEEYQRGKSCDKIKQCRQIIYQNEASLKSLYQKEELSQHPKRWPEIKKNWGRLTELLPEDERQTGIDKRYTSALKIVEGLCEGNKQQVKAYLKEDNQFGMWLHELNKTIDALGKAMGG